MSSSEQYPIYVAGEFKNSGTKLEVTSPYSGEVVYQTWMAGGAEFEASVLAAQAVQQEMQALPIFTRYEILMQISEAIKARRDEFGTILARESGKPMKTSLIEADRAAQVFLVAAEEAKRLPGETMSIDWHPAGVNKEAIVKYFPVGLVAGIAPFNFPLNLFVHKVAPAIAAGCPIILKPASATPISALLLAQLINDTALPKGAVSVLPMDRATGNRLVTDERFALLSFTGSPDVGWEMKKNAGKKKLVLELGGNAGLIVDKDADLERAVSKAVLGAFSFAGQTCIHTQRIYIESSIFEEFSTRFCAAVAQLKIGDPEDPGTDMSAMIDEKNAQRIEAWVNEAVAEGAKVLHGGKRKGTFYDPTVLTNTSENMKVSCLEAFAPIVLLEPFSDFDQALESVNRSIFGLQAGVFTNNHRHVHAAFNRLHVGGLIINDVPTFRADHMPYGGVKDSGIGREGPKYAIIDMMEPRVLVIDHS